MLLLFPREPLSESAVRALVARYGDGDAYEAWLLAQQDPGYGWADQPAVGLWQRFDAPCEDAEVIALVTGADSRSGPAPSDLDANGRCRCGCGFRDPTRDMLDAEARRRTLDAVREALPELDADEATDVAEMLLREHGGREAVVFLPPGALRPSSERRPAALPTCVARFGRLRLAMGAEVAYVQRIGVGDVGE